MDISKLNKQHKLAKRYAIALFKLGEKSIEKDIREIINTLDENPDLAGKFGIMSIPTIVVMEKGEIVCDDIPTKVGIQLRDNGSGMFLAMPTAMRVWAAVETKLNCPMTVRDGSDFLSQRAEEQALLPLAEKDPPVYPEDVTLECDDLWFRYEKDSPDVVKGFSLKLHKGEFYAILGGNGAGKSTTLKVISGLRSAYRGDVRLQGKLGHLPQNPQTLFVKRTVREDLYEVFRGEKIPKEKQDAEVARITELCGLQEFLDRHPYDISGGEQQRTALAKVLLTAPDVLLLDEPLKGLDPDTRELVARLMVNTWKDKTLLLVTHDRWEAQTLCDTVLCYQNGRFE